MIRVALDGNQAALDPKITPPGKNSADKPPASKGRRRRQSDRRQSDGRCRDRKAIADFDLADVWQNLSHGNLYAFLARREVEPTLAPFRRQSAAKRKRSRAAFRKRADGTARQSQADRAALRLRRRRPQHAAARNLAHRWRRFCWGCWAWKRCLPSGSEGNDSDAARLLAIPAERRAGPLDRRGRHAPGLAQLAAARHCATVALGRRRRRGLDSRFSIAAKGKMLSRCGRIGLAASAIPDDGRRARDAARAGDHFHEARNDPFAICWCWSTTPRASISKMPTSMPGKPSGSSTRCSLNRWTSCASNRG